MLGSRVPESDESLKVVVSRHLSDLLADCPPNTILAASVVLVEGATSIMVAVNPAAVAGGPSPDVLKSSLEKVLGDYLKLCPCVVWAEASDSPS